MLDTKIHKIETNEAPKAIGPYSQGVTFANVAGQRLIFCSGMLPVEPATGKMIEGDINELTRRVILNLEAILKKSSSSLHNVVRTDVFLIDLKNDFTGMNEEFAKWFSEEVPPARQTIQVAALPLNARIEISCIAVA